MAKMADGADPSATARRVTAYRLGAEPLAAEHGDPGDDDRLAADVATGAAAVDLASPMGRHLQARTRFFDRVVVNALARHVTQVGLIGAGYDGRALRYRAPGVRWWEVDRPVTQRNKRSRLERLGIGTDGVTFVALDLSDGGVAAALVAAGFEPDAPALFVLEGVAPYLEVDTLRDVLRELRSLATPGTRLAISLRRPGTDAAARACFAAAVEALGEPAVGSVSAEDAAPLLEASRWRPARLSERATTAGFVMGVPVFAPATEGMAPTVGRIGAFVERMLYRSGGDSLAAHLEDTYGIPVTDSKELDLGVHRVARADGSTWIARVFPAARPFEAAVEDASLLTALRTAGIPAERPATPEPVSSHAGQAVLVTDFAPGRQASGGPALAERLGGLLARIHALPAEGRPAQRTGGAWHHLLFDGTVTEEWTAATTLVHDARHRVPPAGAMDYERLVGALDRARVSADLPTGIVHPDFVALNVIQAEDGSLTIVDWAGAGVGARVVSLGCLLWSVAAHGPSVDAAARAYASTVTLRPAEFDHLPAAMALRPAILACWTFATGRSSVADAAAWWDRQQGNVSRTVERARAGLAGDRPERRRSGRRTARGATTSTEGGTTSGSGRLVTEWFDHDGGRQVTVHVPPTAPEAIVFAGDGARISQWGETLQGAGLPSTMIVGVHASKDETIRLHEYSPSSDPARFVDHETFFVDQVRQWVSSALHVTLPAERTAVLGVSASGELALALGLRHRDVYGAVFCASPGAGYRPPPEMPDPPPRTYLVAGRQEPFFRDNAIRWADALDAAGADVVMVEREGSHGDPFWREELLRMVAWAFGR
jgi:methyltransferase (TIGR00027 family)